MASEHAEMLRAVFGDVIEKMAFMFAEMAEEDEIPDSVPESVEARMSFDGPINGVLAMVVPKEMCPEIAANSLGIDPDEEGAIEKGSDAVKELLNMVCGNMLTELAGVEPVFDLTIPQVSELSADEWKQTRDDPGTIALVVDDYPVLVNLTLQS